MENLFLKGLHVDSFALEPSTKTPVRKALRPQGKDIRLLILKHLLKRQELVGTLFWDRDWWLPVFWSHSNLLLLVGFISELSNLLAPEGAPHWGPCLSQCCSCIPQLWHHHSRWACAAHREDAPCMLALRASRESTYKLHETPSIKGHSFNTGTNSWFA